MKQLCYLMASFLAAGAAQAAPYCEALLDKDMLPKKIAKVAPVYSDADSGWIFTQDQLKDRYDMKSTSRQLVQAIVAEFGKRDVHLAILMAPPRPVIAGQQVLDAAMGGRQYDVAAAQISFDALISELANAGAIVPNLSEEALAHTNRQDPFYFRRDTHWTTTGAAISALALAQATNAAVPGLFPNDGKLAEQDLVIAGQIEEEGALADVVRTTCGTSVQVETAATFDLSRAGGLLDTSLQAPSIALVGSSFSNRYKRDHYRVADALAFAFDRDVENFSVSGGGPIGAIEAYVLSGALDQKRHALVIWEIPYTESFNSPSFLRQLLGALRRDEVDEKPAQVMIGASSTTVRPAEGVSVSGIEVVAEDIGKQSFNMEVRFDNGSKSKVYLGRRSAVPVGMRASKLLSNFSFFGDRQPVEIVVTPAKGARIAQISVY
ncbi:alginate O-acetyltransferase AlgX-related protein [Shimia sp. MMG029]|uniref:alginate O-acetyltransferase AlgX-related protein n=1 Tax=Shimia sp. MMG029 TaxID=3021978 RepID=UPI0022FDD2FE|nr:hypothetical protein [Shimia sp. MMG029]MDA5557657.1 hypothetical protein [Shimia sp. MMG029]